MDTLRFLDILGFVIGLLYLILEYRASIWLWLVGIVMPAVDMVLYFKAGIYADFGMAIYYCLAALYGYMVWKWPGVMKRSRKTGDIPGAAADALPITHFPKTRILPVAGIFVLLWLGLWAFLSYATNSTVPVTDAFTTALSIIALWALAQKYAEQWLLWLVVDLVCTALYIYKGIPFKAAIYGLYTLFAVFGYRKWLQMAE